VRRRRHHSANRVTLLGHYYIHFVLLSFFSNPPLLLMHHNHLSLSCRYFHHVEYSQFTSWLDHFLVPGASAMKWFFANRCHNVNQRSRMRQ
jgi:hypothetical protein